MSGSRQKLRAVLLSFVMVTSIMAAGVAFTGTATAASASDFTVTNVELSNNETTADGTNGGTLTVSYDLADGATEDLASIKLDVSDSDGDDNSVNNFDFVGSGLPGDAAITIDGNTFTDVDGTNSNDGDSSVVLSLAGGPGAKTIDGSGSSPDLQVTFTNIDNADTESSIDFTTKIDNSAAGSFGADLDLDSSAQTPPMEFTTTTAGDFDITTIGGDDTFGTDKTLEFDYDVNNIISANSLQVDLSSGDNNDFETDGGELFPDNSNTPEDADITVEIDTDDDDAFDKTLNSVGSNDDTTRESSGDIAHIDLGQQVRIEGGSTSTKNIRVTISDVNIGSGDKTIYDAELSVGADDGDFGSASTTANAGETTNDKQFVESTNGAGTNPAITDATKTGARSLSVTFNEGVTDQGDDALDNTDLSYVNNNGDGIGISSVTHTSGSASATVTTDADVTSQNVGVDALTAVQTTQGVFDIDDNRAGSAEAVIAGQELAAGTDNGVQLEIRGADSTNDVAELLAGNASVSIGEVRLRDDESDSDLYFSGSTDITFPDGVTINTSASDLQPVNSVLTTQDLEVTDMTVTDGGNTLTLDHGDTRSTNGETIRIANLEVDVDGDVIDTTNQPSDNLNVEVDSFGDTGTFNNVIQVKSPSPAPATGSFGGPYAVNINQNGQPLSGDNLQINKEELLKDIEGNNNPAIANQSTIDLTLESGTGVTFDTDSADTISFGNQDLDGGGDDELDPNEVSISGNTLSIKVVDKIDSETNDLEVQGLQVDVSGSAEKADLNVSVTAPGPNTGSYVLDSSGGATISNYVNSIQSPQITYGSNSDSVPVGDSGIPSDLDIDVSSGSITKGNTITISTNVSGAEFTTDGDSDSEINSGDFTTSGSPSGTITNAEINSDGDLVISTDSGGSDLSGGQFEIGGTSGDATLDLKIPSSVADETNLAFTMDVAGAVQVDSSNLITLERPNSQLNGGNNASVSVDQDGEAAEIDTGSSANPSDGALFVNSDNINGQIVDTSNITVSLESGTGVTFDKSVNVNSDVDGSKGGAFEIFTDTDNDFTHEDVFTTPSDSISDVTVNDKTIEIQLSDDGGNNNADASFASGDALVIDEMFLNVSAGASNTSVSVTTNTSDKNEVTTQLSEEIKVDQQQAGVLRGDANFGDGSADLGGAGVDRTISAPEVTKTQTSVIKAENGINNFGGAEVLLEIVETPEGASGASLNDTTPITNDQGLAAFNFTAGETTGDYVVNATLAGASGSNAGLNITYTAQPAAVDDVELTAVENALAGTGGDTKTAVVLVNATDEFGNLRQAQTTAQLTTSGVSLTNFDTADTLADDNTQASDGGNSLDPDTGDLTIDSDGSTAVLFDSNNVGNATITVTKGENEDSATVRFYDEVGTVDVSANESSPAADDKVAVDATLKTGPAASNPENTIEVPDIAVEFDDNQNVNTSFSVDEDKVSIETDTSGVATATVTADQQGTSTIDAVENLKSGSTTLSIAQQEAVFNVSNVQPDGATVTQGDNISTVTAEINNTGSADGTQDIEFQIDTNDDDQPDTTLATNSSFSVDAGETRTVTFTNVSTDSLSTGTFTHGVVSDDDTATATITVEEADETVTVGGEEVPSRFTTTENGETTVTDDDAIDAINEFRADNTDVGTVLSVINAFREESSQQ